MRLASLLLARFAARTTARSKFSGALAGEDGSLSGAAIACAGARLGCSVGGVGGVVGGVVTRSGAFVRTGPLLRKGGERLADMERNGATELD